MHRLFPRLDTLRLLMIVFVTLLVLASLVAFPASAAGVTVDITAKAQGSFTGTNGLGTPTFPLNVVKLLKLTPGVASGKADLAFTDQRTLAASATENLDLAGALTSPLGATLTFAKVKAILIIADAANTNDVVVGGAATNTFLGPFADATDKVSIKPGGVLLIAHTGAGWTVTAATGDILKVANSGGTTGVTYKVILLGTSS